MTPPMAPLTPLLPSNVRIDLFGEDKYPGVYISVLFDKHPYGDIRPAAAFVRRVLTVAGYGLTPWRFDKRGAILVVASATIAARAAQPREVRTGRVYFDAPLDIAHDVGWRLEQLGFLVHNDCCCA